VNLLEKCSPSIRHLLFLMSKYSQKFTLKRRRDSSVCMALGYGLDDRGSIPAGLGILLSTTAFKPALGPTQPPIQLVPGALSLEVKRPGCEADHSPPSSAEVKECVELYFHTPNTSSWRGARLKHRDNFTFNVLSSTLNPMFFP
jgi:hypothetical protein